MTADDLAALVARVSFRAWFPVRLRVAPTLTFDGDPALVVAIDVPDVHADAPGAVTVRVYHRIPMRPAADPVEVLRVIRRAVMSALEHELDETMLLDGRQIRDPHAKGPPGTRLVDRGVTALVDDADALERLRQMFRRPGPAAEDHAG